MHVPGGDVGTDDMAQDGIVAKRSDALQVVPSVDAKEQRGAPELEERSQERPGVRPQALGPCLDD